MPVARGTRIDPAATRRRILDAASGLFLDRGVHAVGVNDVTAAAGASKLSLYKFFPSKRELVAAVIVERSERVHRWLREKTAGRDGQDGVLAIFDLLSSWYLEADFSGCAVVNTVIDTRGDDGAAVPAVAARHLRLYRDLLAERLSWMTSEPSDRQRLTRQLLLLIEGATIVSLVESDGQPGADARDAARQLIAAHSAAASRDGTEAATSGRLRRKEHRHD